MKQEIQALARDNLSGATDLTRQAAGILALRIKTSEAKTLRRLRGEFLATSQAILYAQPTMAPLRNLVNALLWEIEESDSLDQAKERLLGHINDSLAGMDSSLEKIARHTLPLIKNSSTVLTHSFSSAVLATLLRAHDRKKKFAVICSESRPLDEGKRLARRIAKEGIKTRLVADAALADLVQEASLVLVGGDAVTMEPWRLVNKVGTYGLALAAKAKHVPFYVLMSSDKFLPHGYPPLPNPDHDPREVWPGSPRNPNLQVMNRYFDFTPLELVTEMVTEHGLFSPHQTSKYIPKTPLHPELLKLI
ncbi:MAG: hypothetical protein HYX86_04090 [Chloroflexi bacterium]|nr:hypothetical protein [Chloroflexota bacterium]